MDASSSRADNGKTRPISPEHQREATWRRVTGHALAVVQWAALAFALLLSLGAMAVSGDSDGADTSGVIPVILGLGVVFIALRVLRHRVLIPSEFAVCRSHAKLAQVQWVIIGIGVVLVVAMLYHFWWMSISIENCAAGDSAACLPGSYDTYPEAIRITIIEIAVTCVITGLIVVAIRSARHKHAHTVVDAPPGERSQSRR